MRLAVLALLVLLPLAGCLQEADDGRRIEAFQADYQIPNGLLIRLRFGDVVEYRAIDGTLQAGYRLTVNYSAPGVRLGRDETILDRELQPVRQAACSNWMGGDCTRTYYQWPSHDDLFAQVPVFLNLPGWPLDNATRRTTFDANTAPVSFRWQGGALAQRQSYERLSDLAPLPPGESGPLVRLPAGPLLPGADDPLPDFGFSLQEAVAFARTSQPGLADLLDNGGCLGAFSIWQHEPQDPPPGGVMASDRVETRIVLGFTNGTTSYGVEVNHGRKAPFGERGFLAATRAGGLGKFDCAARPPVASLTDLLTTVQVVAPHRELPMYARWDWREGVWTFGVMVYTETGSLMMDGVRGGLAWASSEEDLDVVPAR